MSSGEGVDVSYYQGAIDFHQVKASGKNFVIIRGGDGRFRDPNRLAYREGCLQAGLERDSYHFLRWYISPAEMAEICEESASAIVVPHVWLDCEDTSDYFKSLPPSARLNWLGEVIDRVTAKGIDNDLYTGGWWWVGYMNNTPIFNHKRLWSAEYPFMNSMQAYTWLVRPTLYGGWSKIAIWQYSSGGRVAGVQSYNTDLNWAFESLYPKEDIFMALTAEEEKELKYFLTPRNWGSYDREKNVLLPDKDGNWAPPWFGREGISPMRMSVDYVQPWLDGYHMGTILQNQKEIKIALANIPQLSLVQLATQIANALATNTTFLAQVAKVTADVEAQRMKE